MNRNGKGGFRKGGPGGPGRPKRSTEHAYLDATVAGVSVGDWQAIVVKAVTQAKAGDHRAREWLGRQLIGSDPIPLQLLTEQLENALKEVLDRGQPETNGTATPESGRGNPAAATTATTPAGAAPDNGRHVGS